MKSLTSIKHAVLSLAVAALLISAAHAGAVYGPQGTMTDVLADSTDSYSVWFEGGEPAYVLVAGDGDTDLDLYIYDEYGNLIASDDDATDYCVAGWTPRWTGPFTIEVVNLGDVYNRYSIQTN